MEEPTDAEVVLRKSSKQTEPENHHQDGSASLLKLLETNLDDLRTIITCRICIRPLYEPYTISCGHTFCYSCLCQWFERDRHQKTCPDCRAKVVQQPAPAYLVREITQIFVNRAELIPDGETTQDHHKWSQDEAKTIEKDKKTGETYRGGLFRGCFGQLFRINAPPIRDAEDGVDRCPRCTWELEDGYCNSCNYQVIGSGLSDTGSPTISYFDEDEIAHQYLAGDLYGHRRDSTGLNSGTSTDPDEDDALVIASERAAIRHRFRARGRSTMSPYNRYPAAPAVYSETEDGFDEEDDFSMEDEDAGSLNDFIVHDPTERPRTRGRSLRYDSDEVTDIINEFEGYNSEGEEDHGDENANDAAGGTDQSRSVIDLDTDSDEGPVVRNRRFGYERSAQSSRLSPNDEDVARAHPYNFLRTNSREESGFTSASRRTASPHNTDSYTRGSGSSTEFSGFAIQINSDSDSPPPPPRRRRAIPQQILSDEDEDDDSGGGASATTHDRGAASSPPSSSGTATVGRASPSQSSETDRNLQSNLPTNSPILTNSSSSRLPPVNRHPYLAYEANLSPEDGPRGPRSRTSPTRINRRPPYQINLSRSPRARIAHSRPRNSLETRLDQLRSPRRPSVTPSSPRNHQSTSSRQLANETYARLSRYRDTQKLERQQAKQERRRRERELANNTSRSYRLPASPAESELMSMGNGVD